MNKSEIKEKILEILKRQVEVENVIIDEKSEFITDLDMTSLDIMIIVCDLEEMFDIMVQDKDIQAMVTVGDAINYVFERIN